MIIACKAPAKERISSDENGREAQAEGGLSRTQDRNRPRFSRISSFREGAQASQNTPSRRGDSQAGAGSSIARRQRRQRRMSGRIPLRRRSQASKYRVRIWTSTLSRTARRIERKRRKARFSRARTGTNSSDQFSHVGQGEAGRRIGEDVEERFAEVARADRDQVAPFLLVKEHGDVGQRLEGAAEPVREFPGPLGHAAKDAPLGREKNGDLVLIGQGKRPKDDGFGLIAGHAASGKQGDAQVPDLGPEILRRDLKLGRGSHFIPLVPAERLVHGLALGPPDGFSQEGREAGIGPCSRVSTRRFKWPGPMTDPRRG